MERQIDIICHRNKGNAIKVMNKVTQDKEKIFQSSNKIKGTDDIEEERKGERIRRES